jgi:hypothetical protein
MDACIIRRSTNSRYKILGQNFEGKKINIVISLQLSFEPLTKQNGIFVYLFISRLL